MLKQLRIIVMVAATIIFMGAAMPGANEYFMVRANIDNTPKHIRASGGTVKELKDRIEEMIGLDTKLINAHEDDILIPDMKIELVTSYTEIEEITRETPFETVLVENDQLSKDIENVVVEGVNGNDTLVYELYFEGRELVSKTLLETRVNEEPVNEIIEIGTKSNTIFAGGKEREILRTITMRASAYTMDRGNSPPITATGEIPRRGLVAVDPKFIPLGTWMYVEGYGPSRAANTGGMIKGDAIDLYKDTWDQTYSFGRRNVTVHILGD